MQFAMSVAGDTLDGRYRLGGMLGRGHGGTVVFAATDLLLDRPVAVKVFSGNHHRIDPPRFTAQTRLLTRLSHPSLLRVFDVNLEHDLPYLVTRLVTGTTLRERLAQTPLTTTETARIGTSCAEALAYLHSRQVVHRGVKPANILLEGEDCVLADIGIPWTLDSTRLTATGLSVGTVGYLAPEQLLGAQAGPPTDVYALGLVLLECLTGKVEYPGADVVAALIRLNRPPQLPSWLPARWSLLLGAMTASDSHQRPSAADCARRLTRLAEPETGGSGDAVVVSTRASGVRNTVLVTEPGTSVKGVTPVGWRRPTTLASGRAAAVAAAIVGIGAAALIAVGVVPHPLSESPTGPAAGAEREDAPVVGPPELPTTDSTSGRSGSAGPSLVSAIAQPAVPQPGLRPRLEPQPVAPAPVAARPTGFPDGSSNAKNAVPAPTSRPQRSAKARAATAAKPTGGPRSGPPG